MSHTSIMSDLRMHVGLQKFLRMIVVTGNHCSHIDVGQLTVFLATWKLASNQLLRWKWFHDGL